MKLSALQLVALIVPVLCSCGPRAVTPAGPSDLPNITSETAKIAGGIGDSAAAIDKETAKIERKAPETAPETKAIGEETDRLRALSKRLDAATSSLAAETDRNKGLEAALKEAQSDLAKTKKEVERLKSEKNSLLSYALAGLGVLFFLGVPFSVFVLRSGRAALACGAMFALAIAAQWLLSWAVYIAVGVVALFVLALGVYLYLNRRSLAELVATVEVAKAINPDNLSEFKTRANAVQSAATKRVVRGIKKRMGLEPKPSAPTERGKG